MSRLFRRQLMQEVPLIRVLFIDDNEDLGDLFRMLLEARGDFSVHSCTSATEGLAYISGNRVDAIISDYSMPEMDGISFLKEIRRRLPNIPFIILTGEDSKETAIDALNAGADFYQNKGDELDIQIIDIAHKVGILVAQREAEEAVRRKDDILEAISYAAEQYLKGNILQIDSRDILGRLGLATQADLVSLYNIKESKETGKLLYDSPATWSQSGTISELPPKLWPERWLAILSKTHYFTEDRSQLPAEEGALLDKVHVDSILILPIFANTLLCGYLVFEDHEYKRRASIEIQTLRMAAEIIGSARYRRHIEEFYKCPVEEAILGVFLLCGDEFKYVNPKICSIFGFQREELLKMQNPYALVRKEDQQQFRQHILMIREGKYTSQHFECIGVKKDGSEIFVEMYLTTIKCHESRCVACNLIDVTDRRQIQLSLQESEERYRRLAEQLDDLILVIDTSGLVSYLNPAAASTFSHVSTNIGTDIRSILTGEDFSGLLDLVTEAMNDGSIKTWSMHMKIPDQGVTWYDISITPLKIEDGQISSIVINFHDISYRVLQEEEIRRTGLAQLELNMEQFQILNDEIRNPLQVIKGLNQLQGGDYTDQIEVQLSIINGLIDKLDRAWVQSEKVHTFLLRHYEHGMFIDKNVCDDEKE